MLFKDVQRYRAAKVSELPTDIGVYELCDARGVTRYIGQSVDGIRKRVQRHTTSARSDVIANRLIDAGEIAYIRAYAIPTLDNVQESDVRALVTNLETHLIHERNRLSPLMNGKLPKPLPEGAFVIVPDPITVQILPEEVRAEWAQIGHLLSRHSKLHHDLLDYAIKVKSTKDIWRSVRASERLLAALTAEAEASA